MGSLVATSCEEWQAPRGRRLDTSDHGKVVRRFSHTLDRKRLHSVLQPIVEIGTGDTVAFEALIRGPGGSLVESPAVLFDATWRTGRLVELE